MRPTSWGAVGASLLAAASLAGSAHAAEVTYLCRDSGGILTYIHADMAEQRVTLLTGTAPGRCLMTFRDGAVDDLLSAPEGDVCIGSIGQQASRQFVRLAGDQIQFGARNDGGGVTYDLDRDTGVLDAGEGNIVAQCRRARA